ncbi:MAG TPA: SRPBCC domain-containing protein [Bryobacteraceae bacterium]|nr:SRPBCC domain-containing protein [Bryobacteraceae bacterium]HPT26811.1 SRPBCC domain-containing protein [Bryobacteraceae bacterium]
MKVEYKTNREVTSYASKEATGRTLENWFDALDARGGPSLGRRALTEWLFEELDVDSWWATTLVVEYERARGVLEDDGLPKGYNICVPKTVSADTELVYAQLTDTSWWLGKRVNVTEGAPFNDGQGHTGVFKKLSEGELLRFTWNGANHHAGETVEIKLTAAGPNTSIALHHDRLQTRASADGMREAWAHVLSTLKERLA